MQNYFTLPSFQDSELTRDAQILHKLLLGSLALVDGAGFFLCFALPEHRLRWLSIIIVFSIAGFIMMRLNRRGYVRPAAHGYLGFALAAGFTLAWTAGGIQAPVVMTFPVIVLIAGVLLGWKETVWIGMVIIAGSFGLVAADWAGVLPAATVSPTPLVRAIMTALSIGLLSLLQFIFVGNLDEAVMISKREVRLRRKVEEELRRSEAFRKQVFDSSRIPIVVMDPVTGQFIDCNQATVDMMQLTSKEEVIGATPETFANPFQTGGAAAHEAAQMYIRKALEEGAVTFEWKVLSSDGSSWIAEIHMTSFLVDGRQLLQFTAVDISERMRNEAAVRESEEKFRSFNDQSVDGLVMIDEEGRIAEWNPAMERMIGFRRADVVGRCWFEIVESMVVPERRTPAHVEALKSAFSELLRTGRLPFGRRMFEAEVLTQDGRRMVIQQSLFSITTENGFRVGAINRDVTERRRLETQLLQSQKMEAIGRLAGGVAHDFNNMLSVILGYAAQLEEEIPAENRWHRKVRSIVAAAERSADLTRQLLAFSRQQVIAPVPANLNDELQLLKKMIGRLIGEDIALSVHAQPGLWNTKLDPTQFTQIITNLAVNARDAIRNTGSITITTANTELDGTLLPGEVAPKPGQYVRFTITDTGCGMDAATQSQIFEPFFTTKTKDKGTGLGLSTVFGIVKQNNGCITVESEPGTGTTFTIYFPRHIGEADLRLREDGVSPDAEGCETVLVVEDERDLLEITTDMLRGRGYRVLSSDSPEAALHLAASHPGPIDVLVTDVIMPGMNGRELHDRLVSRHPRLRTLFVSGYTADIVASRGRLEEGMHFLQKPVQSAALLNKIRQMLNA
ncbi:MAG: PAS domain S-box protein [Acidobacteriota bacterium]